MNTKDTIDAVCASINEGKEDFAVSFSVTEKDIIFYSEIPDKPTIQFSFKDGIERAKTWSKAMGDAQLHHMPTGTIMPYVPVNQVNYNL